MGRKKKLINNSGIPQHEIEHIARCILPDILAYYESEEGPYCRGRVFERIEADLGQYDTAAEVFWATGAALLTRTDLYRRLGGLDPKFFAHMEEIDLCWRILLDGDRKSVV